MRQKASQNGTKIELKFVILQKRDFVRIVLFPTREPYFQGSGPPKMRAKRVEKRALKKRHEKQAFLTILGRPKRPQKSIGAEKKIFGASLFRPETQKNVFFEWAHSFF